MTPRKRERRWAPFVATVAVTAFLAVSGVFGATAAVTTPADPGAPTPAAVPAPKSLPAAMDNVAQYQGQSICDPPPKPGIAALKKLLGKTYGNHPRYTSRDCASDPS